MWVLPTIVGRLDDKNLKQLVTSCPQLRAMNEYLGASAQLAFFTYTGNGTSHSEWVFPLIGKIPHNKLTGQALIKIPFPAPSRLSRLVNN